MIKSSCSKTQYSVSGMAQVAFIHSMPNDWRCHTNTSMKITMHILMFISFNWQFSLQIKYLLYLILVDCIIDAPSTRHWRQALLLTSNIFLASIEDFKIYEYSQQSRHSFCFKAHHGNHKTCKYYYAQGEPVSDSIMIWSIREVTCFLSWLYDICEAS